LKQLVGDELYVIDDGAVAEAIVLRTAARRLLPDVTFGGRSRPTSRVRSFRTYRGARSFRLTPAERRPLHRRSVDRALSPEAPGDP
ncbi:MAG: hypothetical protein M3406_12930, partial [Chloroflexota bacterium]|nr:hypothetical protein [Chloroflexota bacterium]